CVHLPLCKLCFTSTKELSMKRSAILCLITLLAAGAQAQTFDDVARVRNVNPQYENVSVPRNECTSQWVTEQQPVAASRNYGGLVYSTVTRGNPGRTLPVRVSVAPVEPVGREFEGAREYQGRRDDRGGREYYGAYSR